LIIAYYLDAFFAVVLCLFIINGFYLIFPFNSQAHSSLIFLLLVFLVLLFTFAIVFLKISLGRYLLRVEYINEESHTKPSLKQITALGTGFFMDSKPENLKAVLLPRRSPIWSKALLFLAAILAFALIIYFFMPLAAKNTGIYRSAETYLNRNEILKKEFGEGAEIGFTPRQIVMENDKGHVIVAVSGKNKSGFVKAELYREEGKWFVSSYRSLSHEAAPHLEYSFSSSKVNHSPRPIKPTDPVIIVFNISCLLGLAVWAYAAYLQIRLMIKSKKSTPFELAGMRRRSIYSLILFIVICLFGYFWLRSHS